MNMIFEVLMFGLWFVLVVFILWFVFRAKTVQPLTLDDLALTWRVHKEQKGCNALHLHGLIKENDEIVGFKCDCGHEFIQKRLISQRAVERKVSQGDVPEEIPTAYTQLFKGSSS